MPSYITTTPDYTPENFGNYIPELYSPRWNVKYWKTTVLGDITNNDFKGEINDKGSIVYVDNIPDITATEEVEGETIEYQRPEVTRVSLRIDRSVQYGIDFRSLLKKQTHHKDWMSVLIDDGTKASSIKIDSIVLNEAYIDAHADNIGLTAGISGSYNMGTTGTPVIITKANIIDTLVYAHSVLKEQNVSGGMDYIVLPIPIAAQLKLSDLKDASFSGQTRSWLLDSNGRLGETIDGMQIYVSNNYTSVSDGGSAYRMIFGNKSAITHAAQLTEHDVDLKDKDVWGSFTRDRVVFGFEVVKPEALGVLYGRI